MKPTHLLPLAAATLLGTLAIGCSGQDEAPPMITTSTLTRAQSCDELLSLLQRDAVTKVDMAIDAQIAWLQHQDDRDWAVEPNAAEDAGGGGNSAGSPQAPEHSETNVQVEGVDEADIVKTDGNYLYVLHGTELAVVTAWPAEQMAASATMAIEGHPLEMFLTDDHIVVYSSMPSSAVTGEPQPQNYDDYYYGYDEPLTKLTVLTHEAGGSLSVVRELYLEGNYTSSRRIGDQVRTVVTNYFYAPFVQTWPNDWSEDTGEMIAMYQSLRIENYARIMAATLADFLPERYERSGGELVEQAPSCGDFYVPTAGSTSWGYTQVASIDLGDLTADLKETTVVGMSHTVYSSHDALYVAGVGYNEAAYTSAWLSDDAVSVSYTHLHKFDIASDPSTPAYVASASAVGTLNDQFSLDEKDGVLRLTTTDQLVGKDTWDTQNHLFTLGPNMQRLGAVTGLAPGEQVFSARFVGNRGYVVTFRQVDPLFVFDLSNPAAPKKLAELKIPGFSNYMHPIEGGDYLLTIGQDGDDDGIVGAPALQIFDVRDATAPALAHKLVLDDGWTEAQYNHKAFTFYQGKLALPFTSWDSSNYNPVSRLDLFDIDVTTGITPHGSVDHSALFAEGVDDCYYYGYGIGVRRGVFIEDYVYSISNGGIIVSDMADMATVATLPMAADYSSDPYGCYY
jgi:Beta propeller domain